MAKPSRGKQIIILGMHRSGTSLVANLVAHAGIDMGEELVKASASNVDGHYEDKAIVELNEGILASAGFRWDAPPNHQQALALREGFSGRFEAYVEARSRQPVWAAKDPRLSLTLPVLHSQLTNPYYIVCSRDEQGVAESLSKRDNFPAAFSVQLKKQYDDLIAHFFAANPDLPHLHVKYNELLGEPERVIEALYNFIGADASAELINQATGKVRSRSSIQESSLEHLKAARDGQLRKLFSNPLRAITPPFWRRFIKLNTRYQRSLKADGSRSR